MGFYQKTETQWVPASIEQVWAFISNPANLKKITPEHMGFEITSGPMPAEMYPGMVISYKVSPLLGIKMTWVTEITQVAHHKYFVDEQRMGPYTMWQHQHHIEPKDGGVLMTDIISYIPPLGILGNVANALFIKGQLNEIFSFRRKAVDAYFKK
jgi:ligand-binding SRPBCC domain-containing protein